MADELPQNQFTVQIMFSTAPEHHEPIINDVLQIFDNFDGMDCDINDYVFPMLTPLNHMLAPSVESMNSHWAAWDDPLSEDKRIHLAVLHVPLFAAMMRAGRACGFSWTVGNPTPATRLQTVLECHLIPQTEWVELCGRLYHECRRLREDFNALRAEHRDTKALLGRVIEALGSRDEGMARELGLVLHQDDIPEHEAAMRGD